MRRSILALIPVALVLGACGGDDASDTTTTQVPVTTTSLALTTTTTVSAETNVATAEAMIDAIFGNDEDALAAMPWAGTTAEEEAEGIRAFSVTVNVEVLDVSCMATETRLVTCRIRTSDDLVIALGADSSNETFQVRFNDSGQVTSFVDQSDDDQEVEAFLGWAFETYPDICDSPAQCATALLEVVDEYLESELP